MALPISSLPFVIGAHVLGVTAIFLVLIWTLCFRGGFALLDLKLIFNLHPLLMLIGLVVLNGEAIILLRSRFWNENIGNLIHKYTHTVAFGLGLFGLIAVFISHKEVPDLHSLHAWIGIGIFVFNGVLLLFQWIYFKMLAQNPLTLLQDDYQGRIDALLRSNEPDNNTVERGRVYGFLRFLIPSGTDVIDLENLNEPAPIRGAMRFFNPRGGFYSRNNQKEQIAGKLHFYQPDPLRQFSKKKKQGRMFGIARFFHPEGGRLEPTDKEKMVHFHLQSFTGTLELTPGWLPWHTLSGMIMFILVVGNAALGFLQKLTIVENNSAGVVPKHGLEAVLVNITAIITLSFGVSVIFTLLGDPVIIRVETSPNVPPLPLSFPSSDDATTSGDSIETVPLN